MGGSTRNADHMAVIGGGNSAELVTSRSTVASRLRGLTRHPESRRAFFFLLVGGICALFNLAILSALTLLAGWSYLPAVLVATEAGVLLSFILNDRITFRELAEHAGGWPERCLRYHGGAAAGQVLIILMALLLIHVAGLKPILAQAISIAVVTVFNFVVQRFLTYATRTRHHPTSASVAARLSDQHNLPPVPSLAVSGDSVPANSAPRVAEPVSMLAWARMRPPADD
ncbi:MAG: GtrA family protein [Ktedonobacterales bacterium]